MRLGVEHKLIQRHDIWLRVQQVEILERLGHPETLHPVDLGRVLPRHVVDARKRNLRPRLGDNGLEHRPRLLPQPLIARDAVQDEDRLDRLGPELVAAVACRRDALGQPQSLRLGPQALVVRLLAVHGLLVE